MRGRNDGRRCRTGAREKPFMRRISRFSALETVHRGDIPFPPCETVHGEDILHMPEGTWNRTSPRGYEHAPTLTSAQQRVLQSIAAQPRARPGCRRATAEALHPAPPHSSGDDFQRHRLSPCVARRAHAVPVRASAPAPRDSARRNPPAPAPFGCGRPA